MNLTPLHEKLNREHPRFAAHLTFEDRDALVRTVIHSIGDVLEVSPPATTAEPPALLEAINKACAIIELGDNRLLASDGPAGGQPPDLTLKEWRTLYVTLDNARKAK